MDEAVLSQSVPSAPEKCTGPSWHPWHCWCLQTCGRCTLQWVLLYFEHPKYLFKAHAGETDSDFLGVSTLQLLQSFYSPWWCWVDTRIFRNMAGRLHFLEMLGAWARKLRFFFFFTSFLDYFLTCVRVICFFSSSLSDCCCLSKLSYYWAPQCSYDC